MFDIIIRPHGDLIDFHAWDEFAEMLAGLVEKGQSAIIIDMAEVKRISSNYIGSIISSYKTANENGRKMTLINVGPKLYDLLEMLKLTETMDVERAGE